MGQKHLAGALTKDDQLFARLLNDKRKTGKHHYPDFSFVIVTYVTVHNQLADIDDEPGAAVLHDESSVLQEDQFVDQYYCHQHCTPGHYTRRHQSPTDFSLPSYSDCQHTIKSSACHLRSERVSLHSSIVPKCNWVLMSFSYISVKPATGPELLQKGQMWEGTCNFLIFHSTNLHQILQKSLCPY